ncbi:hypothetical protein CBM2599_A40127 [Cupriavidus taiwanensis]|nr:hypothetical protein CBM2599_A40127 [Cupriavidus taiwanensis]SOY89753.1 hypothetical protein CBM2600_A50129 [Cupriavidus taiwanensis]
MGLLQVEVTAFHPSRRANPAARLVSVALFRTLPWMAVSQHPALWSPDFPPPAPCGTGSGCLACFAGPQSNTDSIGLPV